MQGRVLDGDRLSGWDKRQPRREELVNPETGVSASTERKRRQRTKEKESGVTQCHAVSQEFRLDTDKDKELTTKPDGLVVGADAPVLSDSRHDGCSVPAEPAQPVAQPAARDGAGIDAADGPPGDSTPSPRALGVRELVAEGVERRFAQDWLKVRSAKRAPLTPTAWEGVKTEAVKAGIEPAEAVRICAANSWQGFKASWVAKARDAPVSGAPPAAVHGGFEQRNYGTGGRL